MLLGAFIHRSMLQIPPTGCPQVRMTMPHSGQPELASHGSETLSCRMRKSTQEDILVVGEAHHNSDPIPSALTASDQLCVVL